MLQIIMAPGDFPLGQLADPKFRLQTLCDYLNSIKEEERASELPALLKRWRDARSLYEMFDGDRALWFDVEGRLGKRPPVPSRSGKHMDYGAIPVSSPAPTDPPGFANWFLAQLVDIGPGCERLAGPCS